MIVRQPRTAGTRAGRGPERSGARAGVHQSVTERGKRPVLEKIGCKTGENRAQGLTHFLAVVAGPWCASEPCNDLRATVDRPRAVTGAVVSRVSAAGARSRTCDNLLSLNRVYTYGMMNVTGRRPFSELGDQQLLEQTRRLATNQRCIEVHILDHLDEIDRRGLALRRGFSSLFDYAVRELRFTKRRATGGMGGCGPAQSGELSMTSAAQLARCRAGRAQSRAPRRSGRCHDQDHDSVQLGRTASEAGEQGERGPRSAPGLAAGRAVRQLR